MSRSTISTFQFLERFPDAKSAQGSADLVIGGPPCQGFSVAGKMDPLDERSQHVFHFLNIVERVQPKAFVLENVKALYANKRWADTRFKPVRQADKLGYNTLMTLVKASHFGVPQARERMLLIGVKKTIGVPMPLTPTTAENPPSVREALSQLPRYGLPGNDSMCAAKITASKSPVLRRSPFAGMLFNGAGRPLNLEVPSLTLAASMGGGNKTPIIDQNALESTRVEPWVVGYHAALQNSGGTSAAYKVPSHMRPLTVEEAAVLQTFPIEMEWAGPQSARFKHIGNAVPPRLALAIAETMKKTLMV